MRTLLINGSPRRHWNTHVALTEVARQLQKSGIETIWIGTKTVQGCIACYQCVSTGQCFFKDNLYLTVRKKLEESDALLIVSSPTYYGEPNGSLCALPNWLFFSCRTDVTNNVWASITVCHRGGANTAFKRLNMYADMNNMVHATSQYWNIAYGCPPQETLKDSKGLQTIDNVAWLLKRIHENKNKLPEKEIYIPYNFIR